MQQLCALNLSKWDPHPGRHRRQLRIPLRYQSSSADNHSPEI